MTPDAARFLDLATRGIEDNLELRLAAETELRLAMEENSAGRETALAEAADSLQRAEANPRRGWWRFGLLGLVLAVSLPMLAMTAVEFRGLYSLFTGMSDFNLPTFDRHIPGLNARQRLLLFGAEGVDGEEKWRPLWQSEPENPVFLSQYALHYFSEHKELSPEILAAAERIDPDNGWYRGLAASALVETAVSRARTPAGLPRGAPKPTPVWKIDDRAKLDAVLTAIHEMTGKSSLTAHRLEIRRERVALLPPAMDLAGEIKRLGYAFSETAPTFSLRKLADALAAGAQTAAAEGDTEGFRRLAADWRWLAERSPEMIDTLVDGLVVRVTMIGPLKNFRDAAAALGLADEEAYFSKLIGESDKEKAARDLGSPALREVSEQTLRRGSILAGMSFKMIARQVKSPPPLAEADLRPGRHAEHALLARAMAWAGWLILGLCAAAAALSRFARNGLARRLAVRMENLFRPADWAWTIGGGVVFPVIFYLTILRLTPFSSWEWSPRTTVFIQPGAQFAGLVSAMIFLPVSIASCRLARRGSALGLKSRLSWIGWLACAAALAAIPAWGGFMPEPRKIPLILTGLALAWLLAGAGLSLLGGGDQALRRATLARLVWPAWAAGMLAMVALVPYFHSEERRWIVQDRIMEISPEFPSATRYESQVTEVLRGELEDLLRSAGEPR